MPQFRYGVSGGQGGGNGTLTIQNPGSSFPFVDDNRLEHSIITEIAVGHGGDDIHVVNFIRLTYLRPVSGEVFSVQLGTTGGENRLNFVVDSAERVTRVFGRSGNYIDSMSIELFNDSTRTGRILGPFGGSGGMNQYLYQVPLSPGDSEIISFWGWHGQVIDTIGVIVLQRLHMYMFWPMGHPFLAMLSLLGRPHGHGPSP